MRKPHQVVGILHKLRAGLNLAGVARIDRNEIVERDKGFRLRGGVIPDDGMVFSDGRAAILDPTFFGEKIAIGPLFHLLPRALGGRANEIFGAFGLAFEDYANAILRRMYPDRAGLASRLRCSVTGRDREGRDFEIDAVLNDVRQVVVFEEKAAWLKDEVVLGDIDQWIEQIRSRYGIPAPSAGGKKERPKGVAQLAQNVRRILDADCGAAQPDFADAEVIHPVLLVHDARLNAPAYGTFLDAEFRALLGDVPMGKRVMPLTVMTIADLENLESSVEEFSMRQLLADSRATAHGPAHQFKNLATEKHDRNMAARAGCSECVDPAQVLGITEEAKHQSDRYYTARVVDLETSAPAR
jgi:hypothetical protein